MDVASVDVIWNGFAQSLKIAALAETHELACAPHNYYSHLATFIAAQWCAAIPNVRLLEIDVDDVPWREELTTAVPEIRDGELVVPGGPGWGCDVVEDVLRAASPADVTLRREAAAATACRRGGRARRPRSTSSSARVAGGRTSARRALLLAACAPDAAALPPGRARRASRSGSPIVPALAPRRRSRSVLTTAVDPRRAARRRLEHPLAVRRARRDRRWSSVPRVTTAARRRARLALRRETGWRWPRCSWRSRAFSLRLVLGHRVPVPAARDRTGATTSCTRTRSTAQEATPDRGSTRGRGRSSSSPTRPMVGALYGSILILDGVSSLLARRRHRRSLSAAPSMPVVAAAGGAVGPRRRARRAGALYAVAPIRLDPMYWHGLGTTLAMVFLPLVVLALGADLPGRPATRARSGSSAVTLVGVGAAHSTTRGRRRRWPSSAAVVLDVVRGCARRTRRPGALPRAAGGATASSRRWLAGVARSPCARARASSSHLLRQARGPGRPGGLSVLRSRTG